MVCPLEQVNLDCGVNAAQSAGIGTERRPAPLSGDVHNVPGHGVEHVGLGEQLIDLGGCGGVELAEHHRRVAEDFGDQWTSIRTDGADLGQRERRHIQGHTDQPGGVKPGQRCWPPTGESGKSRGIENLPADHAAGSAATG